MKITIKQIAQGTIQKGNEEWEKYTGTAIKDGKEITFDSWEGKWNQNWKEGDEIETKNEQWQSREYNGKTYWTLKAPPEARQFGNTEQLTAITIRLNGMDEKIEQIIRLLEDRNLACEDEKDNLTDSSHSSERESQETMKEEIPF